MGKVKQQVLDLADTQVPQAFADARPDAFQGADGCAKRRELSCLRFIHGLCRLTQKCYPQMTQIFADYFVYFVCDNLRHLRMSHLQIYLLLILDTCRIFLIRLMILARCIRLVTSTTNFRVV